MKRRRRSRNQRVKRAALITVSVLMVATAIPVGVLASGVITVSGDSKENKYLFSSSTDIDTDSEDGFTTPRERLHDRMVEKFNLNEDGSTGDSSEELDEIDYDEVYEFDQAEVEESSNEAEKPEDPNENSRIHFADTYFIAHRGLDTVAPENTRSAFLEAGRAGFWGVECDVRETAHDENGDFDLVLCHNKSLKAMTGIDKKVSKVKASDIRGMRVISGSNSDEYNEYMCFLGGYLAVCDIYDMVPCIELKDKHMSDAAYEKIADEVESAGLTSKAIYLSYHEDVLSKMVGTVEARYFHTPESHYLVKPSRTAAEYTSKVDIAEAYKFTAIGFDSAVVAPEMVDLARLRGLKLSIWGYGPSSVESLRKDLDRYSMEYTTTDGVLYDDKP